MSEIFNKLEWFKKIEVLRTIKGWSQEEAAEKCFTGQRIYWSWEKGQSYPRKNSRRAISQAYQVSEEEIFGEEGRK
jgi:transcriptional regulator with XRE-family HTH domain